MREQVLRKAVDKGLKMAVSTRTRTRLAPAAATSSPSSTPHASPARGVATPDGPSAGCPHHTNKSQLTSATPSNSRCVFTQTRSASDSIASSARGLNPQTALDSDVNDATTSTMTATAATTEESRVRSFDEMPGPKGYPVVGTLLEYFRKENHGRMHEIQRRNHRQYGTIFKEPFGPAKNVCVADPSIVEEILRSEGPYPNRPPYESWVLYNNLRKRRGGVMTSQGEYWKTSRRTLNPKLMKPQFAGEYIEGMNSTTEEFITRLRELKAAQADGQSVRQLPLEINKYTMEAVGKVLLNVRIGTLDPDMSPKIREFIEAIGVMFLTGHQLMAFAKVHQIFRTKAWKQHVQAWDTIYSLSNELMAQRVDEARQRLEEMTPDPGEKMDLISYMVAAGTLTREEIIDNLTETFMGGVDTVANGVAFMLYLLATNQSAQNKLREEVDTVLGQRSCTAADLQAMPYVKAVVKETLRLFPPIPLNARVTQEELVISNYRIPKGTIIMLNNYTMSRDERIFSDPEMFTPDRWLRAEVASWHPFSAIPFGYGVRSCVGRRVSENMMYVAAIQMVQKFIMKKDPTFDITPTVRTQFTPGPELPVLFEER
ncbi:cytochrome P450 27C1-like [Littorina saxatilis]|uniref:Cholesterol side-chain cleavage enzyme, mitochondrial n=1 Tax=Littorina saxatilis TaxID=31220 RepID=A0AAN9GQ25_9CAEN